MTRRSKPRASRENPGRGVFLALALILAGLAGGALLGLAVVGKGFDRNAEDRPSFAGLSANPDALVADAVLTAPCPDCADSYGVAARMRAEHDSRLSEPFRRLGEVEMDTVVPQQKGPGEAPEPLGVPQ